MKLRCLPELFAAILVVGCSVREDRHSCPCILDIDLSLFSGVTDGGQLLLDSRQELLFERLAVSGTVTTTKGVHRVCVAGGSGYSISTDTAFIEHAGEGELFTFHDSVVCDSERQSVIAVPRKEFTSVILNIDEDGSASALRISSDYSGLLLKDSSPIKGEIDFIPEKIGPGLYRFRLPRQGVDNSLTIFYTTNGNSTVSLPLNEWVADAGFDWEARDLADINIGAEHSFSRISLNIIPWQTGMSENLTI
ncbi:MAG: hypothetical protein IKR69_05235 [Bacteroidales bacterium]|nr:hypothetical protein [Bacteroidales bacterium]